MASNDSSLVLKVTKPTVFKMRLAPLESLAAHEKMPKDPCRIPIHSYAYSIPGQDLQNHFKIAFNGPIMGSSVWYVDRNDSEIESPKPQTPSVSPAPQPAPTNSNQGSPQPAPAPPAPKPAPPPAPKPAAPPLVLRIARPTVLVRRVAPLDSLAANEKLAKDPCRIPLHSYAHSIAGEDLKGYMKVAFFGPVNGSSVWYIPKNDCVVEGPQTEPAKPKPTPQPTSSPASTPSSSSQQRRINQAGLNLIKQFEGLRLEAYRCPAGVPTIGYGTTANVKMGDRINAQKAEELLKRDLQRFERAVSNAVKVPISDNQFSALVCFTYNVGYGALQKSTLLKYLNQGKYQAAAQEFMKWNRGGGRVLPGLTRRRQAEQALFLKK
jgi:GH24 family phage-related lysozyme (muramidase)